MKRSTTSLDMGVEMRYNSPVESMKALLEQGFDAIFVGSGAPAARISTFPGRYETDRIHIGIDWLESVAFGHIGFNRRTRADHRRRQYGDGLLPDHPTSGRQGHQSNGPSSARLLQSLALGIGGC